MDEFEPVPEHPPVTRRAQFSIKQKIKEEKAAAKGKGKGKGAKNTDKDQEKKKKKASKTKKVSKKAGISKQRQRLKKYEKETAEIKAAQEASCKKRQKAKKTAENKGENKISKGKGSSKTTPANEQPPPKKTRSTSRRPASATQVDIDDHLKQELVKLLQGCGGGLNCTEACHPFTNIKTAAVNYSVYWKTNSVGVLLNTEWIEGYEAPATDSKRKVWKHTCTFGQGNCTQCNILLANKWVSCLVVSGASHVGGPKQRLLPYIILYCMVWPGLHIYLAHMFFHFLGSKIYIIN